LAERQKGARKRAYKSCQGTRADWHAPVERKLLPRWAQAKALGDPQAECLVGRVVITP
jgi:hypothetical protein